MSVPSIPSTNQESRYSPLRSASRETVVRAREAGLADLSDVALLKRLRKSSEWLRRMCVELFRENGWCRRRTAHRRAPWTAR